jgi:hypothetical protein
MSVFFDGRRSRLAYQWARLAVNRFEALSAAGKETILDRLRALPPPVE